MPLGGMFYDPSYKIFDDDDESMLLKYHEIIAKSEDRDNCEYNHGDDPKITTYFPVDTHPAVGSRAARAAVPKKRRTKTVKGKKETATCMPITLHLICGMVLMITLIIFIGNVADLNAACTWYPSSSTSDANRQSGVNTAPCSEANMSKALDEINRTLKELDNKVSSMYSYRYFVKATDQDEDYDQREDSREPESEEDEVNQQENDEVDIDSEAFLKYDGADDVKENMNQLEVEEYPPELAKNKYDHDESDIQTAPQDKPHSFMLIILNKNSSLYDSPEHSNAAEISHRMEDRNFFNDHAFTNDEVSDSNIDNISKVDNDKAKIIPELDNILYIKRFFFLLKGENLPPGSVRSGSGEQTDIRQLTKRKIPEDFMKKSQLRGTNLKKEQVKEFLEGNDKEQVFFWRTAAVISPNESEADLSKPFSTPNNVSEREEKTAETSVIDETIQESETYTMKFGTRMINPTPGQDEPQANALSVSNSNSLDFHQNTTLEEDPVVAGQKTEDLPSQKITLLKSSYATTTDYEYREQNTSKNLNDSITFQYERVENLKGNGKTTLKTTKEKNVDLGGYSTEEILTGSAIDEKETGSHPKDVSGSTVPGLHDQSELRRTSGEDLIKINTSSEEEILKLARTSSKEKSVTQTEISVSKSESYSENSSGETREEHNTDEQISYNSTDMPLNKAKNRSYVDYEENEKATENNSSVQHNRYAILKKVDTDAEESEANEYWVPPEKPSYDIGVSSGEEYDDGEMVTYPDGSYRDNPDYQDYQDAINAGYLWNDSFTNEEEMPQESPSVYDTEWSEAEALERLLASYDKLKNSQGAQDQVAADRNNFQRNSGNRPHFVHKRNYILSFPKSKNKDKSRKLSQAVDSEGDRLATPHSEYSSSREDEEHQVCNRIMPEYLTQSSQTRKKVPDIRTHESDDNHSDEQQNKKVHNMQKLRFKRSLEFSKHEMIPPEETSIEKNSEFKIFAQEKEIHKRSANSDKNDPISAYKNLNNKTPFPHEQKNVSHKNSAFSRGMMKKSATDLEDLRRMAVNSTFITILSRMFSDWGSDSGVSFLETMMNPEHRTDTGH